MTERLVKLSFGTWTRKIEIKSASKIYFWVRNWGINSCNPCPRFPRKLLLLNLRYFFVISTSFVTLPNGPRHLRSNQYNENQLGAIWREAMFSLASPKFFWTLVINKHFGDGDLLLTGHARGESTRPAVLRSTTTSKWLLGGPCLTPRARGVVYSSGFAIFTMISSLREHRYEKTYLLCSTTSSIKLLGSVSSNSSVPGSFLKVWAKLQS